MLTKMIVWKCRCDICAESTGWIRDGDAACQVSVIALLRFSSLIAIISSERDRSKTATTMYRSLATIEQRLTGSRYFLHPSSLLRTPDAWQNSTLPISEQDVLYIFEEIHRARSVAPPYCVPSRPMLLRWKKERGMAWDNLVVFSREEGERFVFSLHAAADAFRCRAVDRERDSDGIRSQA